MIGRMLRYFVVWRLLHVTLCERHLWWFVPYRGTHGSMALSDKKDAFMAYVEEAIANALGELP